MKRLPVVGLVGLVTVLGVLAQDARMLARGVHPIDRSSYTDPRQFAFLAPILKDAEVVALGESIHTTHEFPIVRLGIIRYLNENLGFHVMATEGSPVDVWAAEDRFLQSLRTSQDATEAQKGLPFVWVTPEVRQIFEYQAASWNTNNKFYITAYDVQPGLSVASPDASAFRLLASRLAAYAPLPSGVDTEAWVKNMAPITHACLNYQQSDQQGVIDGIHMLEEWIERAALAVGKRFPDLPHATVLQHMPSNLRASLQRCKDLERDFSRYKGVRDTNASRFVLELKEALPGRKLMLWAHVSHISINGDGGFQFSIGEFMHRELGPRFYSFAAFAESGGAVVIFDDWKEDLGYTRVNGMRGELGKRLGQLSDQDYFLDFRQGGAFDDPMFSKPEAMWLEGGQKDLTLARDFDGIIWIKSIHAPDLPLGKLLLLSLWHWRKILTIAVVVVPLCVLIGIMYLKSRRRNQVRGQSNL